MFGIVAGLFAVAFFVDTGSPSRAQWSNIMGWISGIACVGALSFGVVQAQPGTPIDRSMSFQIGIYMGAVCVLAAALFLCRNPEHADLGSGLYKLPTLRTPRRVCRHAASEQDVTAA